MSFWAKIFGSKKIVDSAISGIDKMFYTDEERAEQKVKLLASYEPFKLALRFLAMVISIPFVVAVIGLIIASFWLDVSTQFEMLTESLGLPFTLVMGFYFADGVGILKGKKNVT